jgi:hypothetical protein
MPRSNNFADKRNFTENQLKTQRGTSGTALSVAMDFSTAGAVAIVVTGITSGGFSKVNVFLCDHHDNEVSVSGTTANIASTVKDISGFNRGDNLRVKVVAFKAAELTTEEMPLLATSQPDDLISDSVVESGGTITKTFRY